MVEQEQEEGLGRTGELAERIGRAGPIVLLPALFLFAYALAGKLAGPRYPLPAGAGEISDAASHGEPDDVGGFLATAALPATTGGQLSVRLAPLKSAPEWQAFDRDALARRFGPDLGTGWRLLLTWDVAPEGAEALGIEDLEVGTAAGVLRPMQSPPTATDTPADPLKTLFGGTGSELAPGGAYEVVVFGESPTDDEDPVLRVRLAGVPETLSIDMSAHRVLTRDLTRSIARADRDGAAGQ